MPSITLPQHWTAHDALVVYEFLAEVQECIWREYGIELTEAYRIECGGNDALAPPQEWTGFDDDIEF